MSNLEFDFFRNQSSNPAIQQIIQYRQQLVVNYFSTRTMNRVCSVCWWINHRLRGPNAILNAVAFSINVVGIGVELTFFPQIRPQSLSADQPDTDPDTLSPSWYNTSLILIILMHAFCGIVNVLDIERPLRNSTNFCLQLTSYVFVIALTLFSMIWTVVTSAGMKANDDYMSGALIAATCTTILNLIWLICVTIYASCNQCASEDENAPDPDHEQLDIAIQASLDPSPITPMTPVSYASPSIDRKEENAERDLFASLITVSSQVPAVLPSFSYSQDLVSEKKKETMTLPNAVMQDLNECAVCFEPLFGSKDVKEIVRCKHRFHASCILHWVLVHHQNSCPFCRGPVIVTTPLNQLT